MSNFYTTIQRLIDEKQFAEARKMLKGKMSAGLGDAQTQFYLGICDFKEYNFVAAEKTFRSVAEKDTSGKIKYYLGLSLERQNKGSEAQRAFSSALSINPRLDKARAKLNATAPQNQEAIHFASPHRFKDRISIDGQSRLTIPKPPPALEQKPLDAREKELVKIDLAKGVYTQQKSSLAYSAEITWSIIISYVVAAVAGLFAGGFSGSKLVGVITFLLFGTLSAIVSAGSVSKTVH
jgi:tetratricopeptide (TPR) repeat protein